MDYMVGRSPVHNPGHAKLGRRANIAVIIRYLKEIIDFVVLIVGLTIHRRSQAVDAKENHNL